MRKPTVRTCRRASLVGLLLGLFTLACVVGSKAEYEAPHAWSGANGVVVPHDSFPADCMLCHLQGGWNKLREDFTFDHEAQTGVRLEGAHQSAQCLRCHNDRGPVSLFQAQGCAGCHEDIHQGELGSQCSSCHEQETWSLRSEIALHNRTRFPLVGSHAALQCWACHPAGDVGNWKSVDVACANCHGDELQGVSSPDHIANGWTASCDRCHIPTTWDGAGFNHFAFVLDGAHRRTDCAECHIGEVFSGVPNTCYGCHEPDYLGTTDPDHAAGSFSTSCDQCHNTSTWEGAQFSHAGISSGCVTCHQADYDDTDDPDHGAAGFSTACEECHNTGDWDDADFQHFGIKDNCATCHLAEYNQTTEPDHGAFSFPQACEECHVTKTWFGASFDHPGITNNCVNCHLADYNGATDPSHVVFSFPQNCEQCHVTRTWSGANFDHAGITTNCNACHQSDYNGTTDPNHQLASVSTSCQLCHGTRSWDTVNMNHAGVGSQCVACHQSDYNSTSRPNHASAGFPTSCDTCHGTNSWTPANFNHQFPLIGGDHGNLDCTTCHTVPGNYRSFTCTNCHAHSLREMADEHDRVSGYVWSSPACYSCHPDGKER